MNGIIKCEDFYIDVYHMGAGSCFIRTHEYGEISNEQTEVLLEREQKDRLIELLKGESK